jgi:apolipoprotein N-acyltransferase
MTVAPPDARKSRPAPADSEAPVDGAARSGAADPSQPAPRRRLRRLVPTRRAWAAAVIGVLTCFAFPPWGWWPLAIVGVALLTLLVRDRPAKAAYGLGIAYSLGFLLPLLTWSRVAGVDGWIILTVSESLLLALIGPFVMLAQRVRPAPLWIALAWVVEEAIRDRVPFGGFPWGRLAFAQSDSPLTAVASWGGAPLLSFAVALAGALLAYAVLAVRRSGVRQVSAWVAVAGLAFVVFGGLLIPRPTAAENGTAVVAAIQGNVPRTGLDALGQKRAVTTNHANETIRLAQAVNAGQVPAPDLVLWPENSSDLDPFVDADDAALLTEAARAIGRPILVGAVLDGPGAGHVSNTGLLWGADGYMGQQYVKRHPVPFAEYLPGRSWIQQIITRYKHDQPNDFVKGKTAGLFDIPGPTRSYRLGDVICFEVAYDGLVRSVVDKGAQLIVVQTNNASFGRSGETYQQLAMGRIRAVEHGRTVVVAATSGLSAIISPDGSLMQRSSLFTAQSLVQTVPLRTSMTIADTLGGWSELALVLLGSAGLLVGVRWSRVRFVGPVVRRTGASIRAGRGNAQHGTSGEGDGTTSGQ